MTSTSDKYRWLGNGAVLVLPVATDRERRLRRWLWFAPALAICWTLGHVALMATGTMRPAIGVPLMASVWFVVMGLLVVASRLAAAHYEGRNWLRANGYRVCPKCEYDLAELPPAGVCPECGWTFDPALLEAEWEAIYLRLMQVTKSAKPHAGQKRK